MAETFYIEELENRFRDQRTVSGDPTLKQFERYVNLAKKLGTTVNQTVKALNKQRNKGRQNVTVKHVHVHKGGQAAIGSFEKGGEGNSYYGKTTP